MTREHSRAVYKKNFSTEFSIEEICKTPHWQDTQHRPDFLETKFYNILNKERLQEYKHFDNVWKHRNLKGLNLLF